MPVSPEEYDKSKQFVNALNDIMNIIDELKLIIPDGKYLEICSKLKVGYDLKDYIDEKVNNINNNSVVREHRTRITRRVAPRTKLTDAEKIQRGYKICRKCDRLVLDMAGHQRRSICGEIKDTKQLSANTGKIETNDIAKAISLIHKFRYKRGLVRT